MKTFDKNVTSQMKTLAFLLMLVHHLWREPDFARFEPMAYGHVLLSIGLIGKICVGIFMFLSGYGLMASTISGGQNYSILNRLRKVMLPFWLIVLIVAPFLLANSKVSWCDVVTDSLLLTSNMNGSWWFMQTYVIFVLCFPLLYKSLIYNKVWIPLFVLSILCFQPIAMNIRQYCGAAHYLLHYFPLFYSGMIARKLSLFDKLTGMKFVLRLLLVIGLVIVRFATGWNILNIGLIIAMIIALIDVQEYLTQGVKTLFNFLGRMSMNMWLIHMFFIAYGIHFSNPFVDLGWIYVESLVAAYLIWWLYNKLMSLKNEYNSDRCK